MQTTDESRSGQQWRYDLSARLYTPETLYVEPLRGWHVVFAPDREGLPVLLTPESHAYLERFRGGRLVSEVLSDSDDFLKALTCIGELFDRDFLREEPATLPYPLPVQGKGEGPESLSVWLHITNSCNLGCSYCFVGEKTREGMSEAVMDQVVEDLRRTAERRGSEEIAIKFAGGEPTLALAAMERFHVKLTAGMAGTGVALQFGVLSNGTVLSDRLLRFLEDNGIGISISVDGYGESHDTHRVFAGSGRGSWDLLTRTIDRLAERGIRPYMMATISEETCESLPRLVRWLYEHQLRARLSVVRQPKGSWEAGQHEAYERLTTTLAAAFDRAFSELEDPGITFDLRHGLDLCELHFDAPAHGSACGIASNHLVIKPDGSLVSCPMEVAKAGVPSTGDLVETCAKTFAERPSDRHVDGENDCLHCQWFGVCASGCPITNQRIKGHAYTRSPLCAFYKAVIPRYLQFFGRKLLQAQDERTAVSAPAGSHHATFTP